MKGSTSSDLHESVNPHFILPRCRSSGFGYGPSDYTHFHTMRLITCALIAFALDTFLSEIILATETNSLLHYPKRTLQPWIFSLITIILQLLHFEKTLLSRSILSLLGFRFFSHPSLDPFQRSLTVLYAIGLRKYLELEVADSYFPRGISTPCIPEIKDNSLAYAYRTITFFSLSFQTSSASP